MPLNIENDDIEAKTSELKKKPTKKTKEMLDENTKQIEELHIQQDQLAGELESLKKEEEALVITIKVRKTEKTERRR